MKAIKCITIGVCLGSAASIPASASMPEKDYLAAIQLADKKVQKKKQSQEMRRTRGIISPGMVQLLLGRSYQVGDSWDVAAWHLNSTNGILKRGIFHYEVEGASTETQPDNWTPDISIKVTQVKTSETEVVDPKIRSLSLKIKNENLQNEKFYEMKKANRTVQAFPDAIHTRISPLEVFPLDFPDLTSAEEKANPPLPVLPASIQSSLKAAGIDSAAIDFSQPSSTTSGRTLWFEQDDFFGRAVQVLWRQGKPWPSYLKTPNGIAILLSKGAK